MTYDEFHKESVENPNKFWSEQAKAVDWHQPFIKAYDGSKSPFENWFVGGQLNLCHNAIDRHLEQRPDQNALVWVSTEVDEERIYTYRQLHTEVQAMAAILQDMGVKKGDRVLIYMPMIPEAAFAMLACLRIGAIHTVVFGGFASGSLATRIQDSTAKVIISADAGSRGGRAIAYKPLVDNAIERSAHKPERVLMVNRGLCDMPWTEGRDVDYAGARERHLSTPVNCVWVDSAHPSYILYTSGTTGTPKGVQRDTGGYTVALAASIPQIFLGKPGDTLFTTSDIGWVVGHSYIIYGPLIGGMTTIMYEGLPIRPDPSIWWSLVERFKITSMFSAPTAIRLLKKEGPNASKNYDLSSLKAFFLAGEPLDETTAAWTTETLGVPVIDNYWQTESGWPILTVANGIEQKASRLGSAGLPMAGYKIKLFNENGAEITEPNQKGIVAIESPLPPGFMQTVWQDDDRFLNTYWKTIPGHQVYNTSDWGIRDEDGYYYILGRSDDVINVAGHRLGTREIEGSITTHPGIAEVAVVGISDPVKGHIPIAFVTLQAQANPDQSELQAAVQKVVSEQLGTVARPAAVYPVKTLPKTRSGKLLRRALQALAEGRDAGDMSTLEDPSSIEEIKKIFK